MTCILISTDGILDITYRTSTGEDVTANTFMPDETELSGDCSDDNEESLTMKFKGFTLFMKFKKTPGGERWYVSTIDLTYSSSNPLLRQIDRPNLQVSVNSLHTLSLIFREFFNIWIRNWWNNLLFYSGEIVIRFEDITLPNASWQIVHVQWVWYCLVFTGKFSIFHKLCTFPCFYLLI